MQGIRMEMDWQRIYSADVATGPTDSEEVSILVYVAADSDEALANAEAPWVIDQIVTVLSTAGEDVIDVRHRGSQDVY